MKSKLLQVGGLPVILAQALLLIWAASPHFVSVSAGSWAVGSSAEASSWATALHRSARSADQGWLGEGEKGMGRGPAADPTNSASINRLQLIAPDNNDTVITLADVKREGVLPSLRQLMVNTRLQCTGAQAEPLTIAQRQMELRAYGTTLANMDSKHRELTPMQAEAIAEMPLCDEYILDLVMISRLLEGYQLP